MITDGKKWHYLSVTKVVCITQRNNIHSCSTKDKLD